MHYLHSNDLIHYEWVPVSDDDAGSLNRLMTFAGRPSDEFVENSGLVLIAEKFDEKEHDKDYTKSFTYYFKIQDSQKFFMSCLKLGMIQGEQFSALDMTEENLLSLDLVFPPNTLTRNVK